MRARVAVLSFAFAFGCKRDSECEGDTRRVDGSCVATACTPPFALLSTGGCDAPKATVLIPARTISVGPSDWEAEGRVAPRTVTVSAFRIDSYEVTEARYGSFAQSKQTASTRMPVTGVTLAEASAFCKTQSGRLPTEDEWMSAAMGDAQSRYPWGDTGAVCVNAAWGKSGGQCARASTPDAIGAHPRGATKEFIFDLAGNVAEWVTIGPDARFDVAKGGSYASSLATELRNWSRSELPLGSRHTTVGFRCAYDAERALK